MEREGGERGLIERVEREGEWRGLIGWVNMSIDRCIVRMCG